MAHRSALQSHQRARRPVKMFAEEHSKRSAHGAVQEIASRAEPTVGAHSEVLKPLWAKRSGADRRSHAILSTLVINIPRFHNPDGCGMRTKVNLWKLKLTLRELKDIFSGYTAISVKGWSKDDRLRDSHYRFEIDFNAIPALELQLEFWKRMLEIRFRQNSVYMRVSTGARWL
jgi:hypothetical protein